jgi:hypothetical protein
MTANELADLIENEDTLWLEPHLDAIANMLRQQAQEIAMLKQIIDANNLQSDIGQLKKELALQRLSDIGQEIERELTDEEIYAEMIKCIDEPEDGHTFRYKDFARAILKKASEK